MKCFSANWLLRSIPALTRYLITSLSPELGSVANTKLKARKAGFSLPAPHLVQIVVNAASSRLKSELNLPPFDAEHAYSYREPNTGSLKRIQPFHSYSSQNVLRSLYS